MKEKKDIEVILNEMIEEVIKLGLKPTEIWLDDEDHASLEEKMPLFIPHYEVKGNMIIYKKKQELSIEEYKGLPVTHSNVTAVRTEDTNATTYYNRPTQRTL